MLAQRLTAVADRAPNEGESFGGGQTWDRLSEAVIRLRGSAGRLSGHAAEALLRAQLHRQAATFIGDVFSHLDRRGERDAPGPIPAIVIETLTRARAASEPLVVVAHSMGGPITYDVLSYYRPDLKVKTLVTVGSQVGVFEELCLLQKGKADGRLAGPTRVAANIERWINVFDTNDLLGFAASRIFEGATNFEV